MSLKAPEVSIAVRHNRVFLVSQPSATLSEGASCVYVYTTASAFRKIMLFRELYVPPLVDSHTLQTIMQKPIFQILEPFLSPSKQVFDMACEPSQKHKIRVHMHAQPWFSLLPYRKRNTYLRFFKIYRKLLQKSVVQTEECLWKNFYHDSKHNWKEKITNNYYNKIYCLSRRVKCEYLGHASFSANSF